AGEQRDDVARDWGGVGTHPETALHRMRDQRLDLDDLAALCLGRDVDQRACHRTRSSTQAASVTTTSALSVHNEPSLISARAVTCCESASLMRVDKRARPARGPSLTETTCGCGFFSVPFVKPSRARASRAYCHRTLWSSDSARNLVITVGAAPTASWSTCAGRARFVGGPTADEGPERSSARHLENKPPPGGTPTNGQALSVRR